MAALPHLYIHIFQGTLEKYNIEIISESGSNGFEKKYTQNDDEKAGLFE